MMKRLINVCILIFCIAAFSGCSDSDSSSDRLHEFRDSADALRDVFFNTQAEITDESTVDYVIAREDLQFFDLFIKPTINQIINFNILTYSEGVYTNTDRTATISVSGSTYTYSKQSMTSLGGETSEVVRVDLAYNVSTDRWLFLSYRGGTSTSDPTEVWFKQEGDAVGDLYYVATTFYLDEEADPGETPPNAPLHISNLLYQGAGSNVTSVQMALERDYSCTVNCMDGTTELYPDGVVAAGIDSWTNFRLYHIDDNDPDYTIQAP